MAKKILEPIEINGMKLKNRIAFAPFLNMPREADGTLNDLTTRWFEERAKGGLGFIMTGAFLPTMVTTAANRERLGNLAEVIHSYDVKIGVQIVHGGPMGGQGPSPSPYPDAIHAKMGQFDLMMGSIIPIQEITVEQIHQYQEEYAAAAIALKECGIDCVLLHCAHGGATLCCSFISPFYNHRTDEYGGNWENRLRLPVESIQKMRKAVGPDYPILARIDVDELLGENGITVKDAQTHIVPALEKAGVDCIDASQGSILHSPQGITIPLYYPRGCFIDNAEAVKQVTKLPVIGVGNIFDMDMVERFLEENKADIIYMGRQVTADPETPKKYFEGRAEDIRKCIGCVGGCGRPCTVNYDIQDNPIPLTPAKEAKKVVVIGGGVGGMEAARIATLRGHKVTLIERDSRLGGMVAVLSLNPLLGEFGNIVNYLATQLRKLGVDVRICKEATAADIEAMNADVVILATGSSAQLPEIAREKLGVMTCAQAYREPKAVGQRVVVWGLFGAELAIALAEAGKDVVLLGKAGEGSLGSDIAGVRRFWLLRKLTDTSLVRESPEAMRMNNPRVLYQTDVDDITIEGIKISDKEGNRQILPYDTLIIAQRFGERKKNDSLFDELQGKVGEIQKIGDCSQVRGILEAIHTANGVARKV